MKGNKVTETIIYVGVDDKEMDLFENQYATPNGISYNSYIILDEKIAIMDTVDARKTDEWIKNIENEITNKVASKFSLLVGIMKFIGYSASFISFIALLSSEETGFAFLCLIGGAIFTWLSTLFFEAVAEGLQLLQDIKDKI